MITSNRKVLDDDVIISVSLSISKKNPTGIGLPLKDIIFGYYNSVKYAEY